MATRFVLIAVAITALIASACTPVTVTPPATSAAPATPAPTPSATLARPSPTATAGPSPTPSPSTSPSTSPAPLSCPSQTGGNQTAQAQITAIRAAHNPGFDRVVFEFGPAPLGTYALPPWSIAVTNEFIGTSGRQVPVDGNAFLSVRFSDASTVDPTTGKQTFTNTDIRPGLPLVRQVRLIDDFERVMNWGIGLERLACPKVSTLTGPVRLVVDLPTPP
ncbi:MAG: hypothetical protein QOH08_1110 [Chloroflexota bacterium]|nr:hypothetical protein [Chloroflexota bacterium]